MLKPLADFVAVKVVEVEVKTASGIVLPDTAIKEKSVTGIVAAVGPGKVYDNGVRVPVDVKVGDQVYFAKFGGQEVTLDGEKFLLICERDIFAVVTKD